MNKVQDVNLKMKKRYWDFPRKSEENKNYVTILFFDLVFNKKRKKSRPNTCSYEKRIKHMQRKQSTTTYSKLVSHITTWELANTKIMVHSFQFRIPLSHTSELCLIGLTYCSHSFWKCNKWNCTLIETVCVSMCVSISEVYLPSSKNIIPESLLEYLRSSFFTDTDVDSSFLKTFTVGLYFNGACHFKVGFFLVMVRSPVLVFKYEIF